MKTSKLLFCAGLVLAVAFASTPRTQAKEDEKEAAIEKITLVKDAGDSFKEVEAFKPADTLGVLVKLNGAPKSGTKVKAIWIIANAGGMKEKKIFEKEVEFTAEALKDAKIKDRVDFTLSHDNPYPTGDYKVEIYLNGDLSDTVEFSIEE